MSRVGVCYVRKPVQKSIAELIATIAKHDLPRNRWPTLFQFLEQFVHSDDTRQREVHTHLLCVCVLVVFV